jgi:hypothetical protein
MGSDAMALVLDVRTAAYAAAGHASVACRHTARVTCAAHGGCCRAVCSHVLPTASQGGESLKTRSQMHQHWA